MESKDLMVMTETKMMERINTARFPSELSPADKKLLAMVAITYGFDPLMGEITIYQGRPYVSIDGRYRKAQETERLIGVKTRPATKQEREEWRIPDDDYFFHAEVYVKGGGFNCFEGWGRVRKAETVGGKGFKPIETNPQRMAEKRAEAQALRKAFHIPLPSLETRGTEEDDDNIINVETGEVIDRGEPEQPDREQAEKDTQDFFEQPEAKQASTPTEKVKSPTPKQEPEGATPIQKLLNYCQQHGKKYDATWVCKQLNVPSTLDIRDFENAYATVREIAGWDD